MPTITEKTESGVRKIATARSKCEEIFLKERRELNASEEHEFVQGIELLIGGFRTMELQLQLLRRPSVPGIMDSLDAASLPSPEWSDEKNARRCDLIDKKIEETISDEELLEFEELQTQMRCHLDRIAPFPIEGAKKLHQKLLKKKREQEGKK